MASLAHRAHRYAVARWLPALLLLGALLTLLLAGCGAATTASVPEKLLLTKDANGTALTLPAKAPQRIVSLTPSDSEILAALGLTARVVGVDNYTNYPAAMAAKTKISGAAFNSYNVEQIVALQPDLVLDTGDLAGTVDKQLLDAHIAVVDLPSTNLQSVLTDIRVTGQLTRAEQAADTLVAAMQKRINAVKQKVMSATPVSVYMELDDSTPGKPYAFGGGSFGDELISDAGGKNIFASDSSGGGYPQVSDESVIAASPQVIILTEDPAYGGDPKAVPQRTGWANIPAVQQGRIYGLNADISQRPGPRLVDALEQLAKDLHPDRF